MKKYFYLTLISTILITTALFVVDDAYALKSKGNSLPTTSSNNVCGLELCTSSQSISEKIDIFLEQNDVAYFDSAFQQSFDLGRRAEGSYKLNSDPYVHSSSSSSSSSSSTFDDANESRDHREKSHANLLSTLNDSDSNTVTSEEISKKLKLYMKTEISSLLEDIENMEYEQAKNKISDLSEALELILKSESDHAENIDKN